MIPDHDEARYEFVGDPSVPSLLEFVSHMATPVLQPNPASDDETIAVSMHGYPETDPKMADAKSAFSRLAKYKRSAAFWHYTTAPSVDEVRIELKHRGEPKRTFYLKNMAEGTTEEGEMRTFFFNNTLPMYE